MDFETFVKKAAALIPCAVRHEPENEELHLSLKVKEDRKQIVRAYQFEESGKVMVRFYTVIGKADAFSEKQLLSLLELNFSLLQGAFALYAGEIIITETIPLEESRVGDAVQILHYIAQMADSYEKMTLGLDKN
ncbi:MAG: hypothetical protein RDV48_04675 [Candidatus Eremiobacteraeota bacterium]|nr:hypothetical protein [Candidatus Eremiobacteraeota bacterium]